MRHWKRLARQRARWGALPSAGTSGARRAGAGVAAGHDGGRGGECAGECLGTAGEGGAEHLDGVGEGIEVVCGGGFILNSHWVME
jgi:hypothetical protein